jgi:hypothetical protein
MSSDPSNAKSDPAQEKRYEELAAAIGGAVIAVAGLEKTLLGEIYRQQRLAGGRVEDVEVFDRLPGGKLVRKLRTQGIDGVLASRIDDLIKLRNTLIHGFLDDVDVAVAVMTGDGFDEVRVGAEDLGTECSALSRQMQAELGREIESVLGASLVDIAKYVRAADLSQIDSVEQRAELERARALIELTDWPHPPHFGFGSSPDVDS